MLKTLRFMLLTLLAMVGGTALAQTTVTWESSANDALSTIYVGNDLVFTWEEKSGDQAPLYSQGEVRLYKGNTLTIAGASEEVKITKVVFAFGTRTTQPGIGFNVGTISSDYANVTTTWTGEHNSILFTATGARYIKSIEVTYTG